MQPEEVGSETCVDAGIFLKDRRDENASIGTLSDGQDALQAADELGPQTLQRPFARILCLLQIDARGSDRSKPERQGEDKNEISFAAKTNGQSFRPSKEPARMNIFFFIAFEICCCSPLLYNLLVKYCYNFIFSIQVLQPFCFFYIFVLAI